MEKGLFSKIKRGGFILATISLVSALNACSRTGESINARTSEAMKEEASFRPIKPESWQLSNGLTVLFLKDDELPVIRGRLFLRGGELWNNAHAPAGIVSAMGTEMRQGGAGSRSADQLDFDLEKLSASVTSSFGAEWGSVGFACLSQDLNKVFPIFVDVALQPRFEKDRLNLWKGLALDGIQRRREDPGTVAGIAFQQLLYGTTPYGRVTLSKDVEAINRQELQQLHKYFVRPNGAILAITGKADRQQIERMVQDHFGTWEKRSEELASPPAVDFKPTPGIYFVELPFAQSTVQMGQLGLPRLTPDYMAIDLFNEVFGSGGFGSLLMKRIRTELGLSYGIFGGIAPGVVKGMNFIQLQTKAQSTAEAIAESMRVLQGVQRTPVENALVLEKRHSITNSFVFNFESSEAVISRAAHHMLLSYPEDFDDTYLAKLKALTPMDIKTVASERWNLSDFVIVVVGNNDAYTDVARMMSTPPDVLKGFELRRFKFGESLEVN